MNFSHFFYFFTKQFVFNIIMRGFEDAMTRLNDYAMMRGLL